MASFSFYGQTIDVAAPGDEIWTTALAGYVLTSGTSFGAPLASGVAALLLERSPGLSPEGLIAIMNATADTPSGIVGKVESGRISAGSSLSVQFIDIVGHLFEGDIEWAAEEGITKGCNPPANTLFCPDDPVSREVMAAFINRALNLPAASKDYFSDDNNSIFEDDINRMAEAGITTGCGGTNFCPENVVDRGQMAAFVVRALGLVDDGGGDLFIDDDNSIFEHDIDRLAAAGITKGCNPPTNNKYCPTLDVDRGAMTAFLHRALGP